MRHPLLTMHYAVALSRASHLVLDSLAAANLTPLGYLTCRRHHGAELSFHFYHQSNLDGSRTHI